MANVQQVPFWVQILAICLAPILGFVGVAVGAVLQANSSRRLALRSDRREAYAHYAGFFIEVQARLVAIDECHFDELDREELQGILAELRPKYEMFKAALLRVELVGSKKVVTEAMRIIEFWSAVAIVLNQGINGRYISGAWDDVCGFGLRVILQFQQAAAVDLGVPKCERSRVRLLPFGGAYSDKWRRRYEELRRREAPDEPDDGDPPDGCRRCERHSELPA